MVYVLNISCFCWGMITVSCAKKIIAMTAIMTILNSKKIQKNN